MIEFSPSKIDYPKKKWGQNFLVDRNIARKILDCADIQAKEAVIEIGPGRGILTEGLLERGAKVRAIEIDRDLIRTLHHSTRLSHGSAEARGELDLIQGDALDYSYSSIPAPYKVVSNLPYNISSPILFRLLEEKARISRMVLMLQKEVAERLVATVNEPAYGALSIIMQSRADVSIAFSVSPNCFRPRPKVGSAVLRILPRAKPKIPSRDEILFVRLVRGAFQHRRKTLSNALVCSGFDLEDVHEVLSKMDIDPRRRAETLSITDFAELTNTMQNLISPVDMKK
ncbi:MAG: 16S rRNA (adenine(1518)-N(6)/adenine(1519)-N(6))-dimethyltransferase RsmA [Nitrospiria bacterium]